MNKAHTTGYIAPVGRYVPPVLFNPYTGEPRDARDIASDPRGVLIVPPGARLAAASTPAAAPVQLPEPDAVLLNQGVELLHALSNDERNRGNCSSAEGATASAYAVQRLAALLATGGQAQAVATLTEEALAEKIRSHGAYGGLAAHLMPFIAQHAAPQAQADARDAESAYQRGYRHGYNRRDAEVQGALL